MAALDTLVPHAVPAPRMANAAGAAMVVLTVLLVALLHYQGETLIRGSDAADILLAYFHEASRAIAADGPLAAMYSPGALAGMGHWSNPNFHPLYPFYFNWTGADATVFATLQRMNLVAVLHMAILGGGGFQLARQLGVRMLPALAVGLALPWMPAMRSAAGWPQIIAGLAWVPWVLACQVALYRAGSRREALPAVVGLVLAATLLVYAQPAQNLVFAVVASVVAWLAVALPALATRDRDALRRLGRASAWLAVAAVAVGLLSGAYLLEVLRFHATSLRWLGEYGGSLRGDQPVPVGALRFHALPFADAWRLLAFDPRRGIGHAFMGAAVLFGALALLRRGDHPARGVAACGSLAVLACFAFAAPVLHAVPAVNKVRELVWWSCLAAACLLPAAAAGLQSLLDDRSVRGAALPADRWTALAALAMLAGLLALAMAPTAAAQRIEGAIALLAGFAAFGWVRHGRPASPRMRDMAIASVLLSVAWVPFRQVPPVTLQEATLFRSDRVEARDNARRMRAMLPDLDNYRMALDPSLTDSNLLVHSYMTAGLRTIRGGISPANAAKFDLLYFPGPALAALYGVKYTVWPASQAAPGDRPLRPGWVLRTDPRALPRLFFVPGAPRVVADAAATLAHLKEGDAIPLLVAPVDRPGGIAPGAPDAGAAPPLPTLRVNRPAHLQAQLASARGGVLVLNEDPEGRWWATIDGTRVRGFRVNGFQTGFVVPGAGRHAISIERPTHLVDLLADRE